MRRRPWVASGRSSVAGGRQADRRGPVVNGPGSGWHHRRCGPARRRLRGRRRRRDGAGSRPASSPHPGCIRGAGRRGPRSRRLSLHRGTTRRRPEAWSGAKIRGRREAGRAARSPPRRSPAPSRTAWRGGVRRPRWRRHTSGGAQGGLRRVRGARVGGRRGVGVTRTGGRAGIAPRGSRRAGRTLDRSPARADRAYRVASSPGDAPVEAAVSRPAPSPGAARRRRAAPSRRRPALDALAPGVPGRAGAARHRRVVPRGARGQVGEPAGIGAEAAKSAAITPASTRRRSAASGPP